MTEKNCENCGQVIGNVEESYPYYHLVVCKACKAKLENPFQYLGTTSGDSETEASTAEVRIEKDSVSEAEARLTENRTGADLSQHIEAEIPVAEVPIERNRDLECQTPATEEHGKAIRGRVPVIMAEVVKYNETVPCFY